MTSQLDKIQENIRPWAEFLDQKGFAAPKNPAERIASNVNYYSYNYIVIFLVSFFVYLFFFSGALWIGVAVIIAHSALRERNVVQKVNTAVKKLQTSKKKI